MGNMEGIVTLVFFKIESKNLVSWGILRQVFKKLKIPKFKASMTSVTLPFLKVAQNLVCWDILTYSLKFRYFISIISFADTL